MLQYSSVNPSTVFTRGTQIKSTLFISKTGVVQLLENIGNIELVSSDDGIYRLNLPDTGPRGVKKGVYRNLKRLIKRYGVYRTYDLIEAKKSVVFLEPIMLPKEVMEALNET